MNPTDYDFLYLALKEAKRDENEVPVGAVLVYKNKVVAKAHNQTIKMNDPTSHAEILVIKKSAKKLKNYRLNGTKIYITKEPCPMCAGAIVWARISEVIYGCKDKKSGSCGTVFKLLTSKKLNHRPKIKFLKMIECKEVLQDFFKKKRIKN